MQLASGGKSFHYMLLNLKLEYRDSHKLVND